MGEHDGSRLPLLDAVLAISSDLDLEAMLRRIVERAVELVDARYGALGALDESGTQLAEFVVAGLDDEQVARMGHPPKGLGLLGELIDTAAPIRVPNLADHPASMGFPPGHPPMRSFLGVPIRVRDAVFGNLYLTDKRSASEFTAEDEALVVGLASAAGVAIENARMMRRIEQVAVLEDRERIARDLHDTVIQRLFATGMSLESTIRLMRADTDAAVERVSGAVDELDLTIKHIRTVIFDLEHVARGDGLRARLIGLGREAGRALGFEPRVVLDGPIDTVVPADTADSLIAAVREGLSNVVRHARATQVDVEVAAGPDVCLRVVDNGVGLPASASTNPGHGLRNLTERAGRLGGSMVIRPGASGGTVLEWRVPLEVPA